MEAFGRAVMKKVKRAFGGGEEGGAPKKRKASSPENEFELLRQERIKKNKADIAAIFGMKSNGATPEEPSASKAARGQHIPVSVPSIPEVLAKWSEREEQIRLTAKLLPPPATSDPPIVEECQSRVLLVNGPSGTGKTGVIKDFVSALRLPYAYIRGVEHHTSRTLYATISAAWMDYAETEAEKEESQGGWNMMLDEEDGGVVVGLLEGESDEEDESSEEGPSEDDGDEDIDEEEGWQKEGSPASSVGKTGKSDDQQQQQQQHQEEQQYPDYGVEETKESEVRKQQEKEAGAMGEDEQEEEVDEDEESAIKRARFQQEQEDAIEYEKYTAATTLTGNIAGAMVGTARGNRHNSALGLLGLFRSWNGKPCPFIIILDSADRLPRGAAQVIHEMLELPAMLAERRGSYRRPCLVSLTVILISETPTATPGALASAQALNIHFPAYTKNQAESILLRSLRAAAGLCGEARGQPKFERLIRGFVQFLVASLYGSTRNVTEMRRIAVLLSGKFLEPLFVKAMKSDCRRKQQQALATSSCSLGSTAAATGAASGSKPPQQQEEGEEEEEEVFNEQAMLEGIRPMLQRAVKDCLHLLAEPLDIQRKTGGMMMSQPTAAVPGSAIRHEALIRHELPQLARFLLVAAYLASHNSQETDLYVFTTKNRGRKKIARGPTGQQRADDEREEEAEAEGAKSFQLERLLSIFTQLVTLSGSNNSAYANRTGNTELFAQINSLVHYHLLTRVGGGSSSNSNSHSRNPNAGAGAEYLNSIKFKCNVGYDLILLVAQDLEIQLNMYLQAARVSYNIR